MADSQGRSERFSMLSINISKWGDLTENFIKTEEANCFSAIGCSELHLGYQTKLRVDKFAQKCGMHSDLSCPGATQVPGSVLHTRRGLDSFCIPEGTDGTKAGSGGQDWAGRLIRLWGNTILFIQCYLTSGIGPAAQNLEKLHEMECCIHALGTPFIVAGDFNMTPAQLQSTGWQERIQAQIVAPKGVTGTCTNGGRLIDFAVVSLNIIDMIEVRPFAGPWETHVGLDISCPRKPSAILARQTVPARELPQPSDGAVADWQSCVAEAAFYHFDPKPAVLQTDTGGRSICQDHLNDEYFKWSKAVELYTLRLAGIHTGQASYMGRGDFPRIKRLPLIMPTGRLEIPSSYPLVRTLGAVGLQLAMMRCLLAKGTWGARHSQPLPGHRLRLYILLYSKASRAEPFHPGLRHEARCLDAIHLFGAQQWARQVQRESAQGLAQQAEHACQAGMCSRGPCLFLCLGDPGHHGCSQAGAPVLLVS